MALDVKMMVLFFQLWVTDDPFDRHLLNRINQGDVPTPGTV